MPKAKVLSGQIAFDLFDKPRNRPGNCPHETKTVDVGGGKSYCDLMQVWTNCREVGHCVYDGRSNNF